MLGQDGQEIKPAAGQMPVANLVKDTTTATFREDVIAESARQPVLVDFWAPWCGPCKQLTPVIEKAVAKAGGKVKLVKMNIDEHPQIAGQLGVKSIPAVIAFQRGQPIDGFMGALPESQIKSFIERLVGPLQDGNEDALADAAALVEAGEVEAAAEIYAALMAKDPGDLKAIAGLAKCCTLIGDLEQAREVLALAPAGSEKDVGILAAIAAVELAAQAADVGDVSELLARIAANGDDHEARFDLALALNGQNKRDEAADALLEIIRRNRSWRDDAARTQLMQFFEAWGQMDAATRSARRKLSAVLFT